MARDPLLGEVQYRALLSCECRMFCFKVKICRMCILRCELRSFSELTGFNSLGLAYGLLVCGGGIYGYIRSGSVPSIVAGMSFGALSIAGSAELYHDPTRIWILLSSSVTLSVLMGARYFSTGKFMPAGLLSVISMLMSVKLLAAKYT